jgi:hypothetical protein
MISNNTIIQKYNDKDWDFKLNKPKKIKKQKLQLGVFPIEEVLPYTNGSARTKEEYMGNDGKYYEVNMCSLRYSVFKESLKCVCCGQEGLFFILEMLEGDKIPHFNLYGVYKDRCILFTKDHIKPKSKKGKDCVTNLQTMCSVCNELKQNNENIPYDILKHAKELYLEKGQAHAVKWLTKKINPEQEEQGEENEN